MKEFSLLFFNPSARATEAQRSKVMGVMSHRMLYMY